MFDTFRVAAGAAPSVLLQKGDNLDFSDRMYIFNFFGCSDFVAIKLVHFSLEAHFESLSDISFTDIHSVSSKNLLV